MTQRGMTFSLTVMAVLSLWAAGCASSQARPGASLKVIRGQSLDHRVRILWIDAQPKGDRIRVHGAVQRLSHTRTPIQTHVDLVVTSADGTPLQRSWSQDLFVAGRTPGKGPDWTAFDMTLPGDLPAGATLQAACHNGPHQTGQVPASTSATP
jgi:hypothetical protein